LPGVTTARKARFALQAATLYGLQKAQQIDNFAPDLGNIYGF